MVQLVFSSYPQAYVGFVLHWKGEVELRVEYWWYVILKRYYLGKTADIPDSLSSKWSVLETWIVLSIRALCVLLWVVSSVWCLKWNNSGMLYNEILPRLECWYSGKFKVWTICFGTWIRFGIWDFSCFVNVLSCGWCLKWEFYIYTEYAWYGIETFLFQKGKDVGDFRWWMLVFGKGVLV